MSKSKCPQCGFKLGNYLYADACPKCRQELKHNTRLLVTIPTKNPARVRVWPIRFLRSIVQLVESWSRNSTGFGPPGGGVSFHLSRAPKPTTIFMNPSPAIDALASASEPDTHDVVPPTQEVPTEVEGPLDRNAPMLEQRIKDLESQLVTAGETVASLKGSNAELTERLSDAETRNKKLKRSSRRDESSFKEQLAASQGRRG
jgi:hypothetical protein